MDDLFPAVKYKMRNTQVRLDLESFTLVDPDETGNCRTDYMQVTPYTRRSTQSRPCNPNLSCDQ